MVAKTAAKKAASAGRSTPARKPAVTTRSARSVQREPDGPLYQVIKEASYLNNVLYPVGSKVVYYGEPGSTLLAVNAEAKARKIAVRDIRQNPDLDAEEKKEALRALSDEWNGVTDSHRFADSEANLDDDIEAEEKDPELVKQAVQTRLDEEAAAVGDPNRVRVKLDGSNEPQPTQVIGNDGAELKAALGQK